MSGLPNRPPIARGAVYVTGVGRTCPQCAEPAAQCRCAAAKRDAPPPAGDGIVRLRRETQGRRGKVVTVIDGVPLSGAELDELAKRLKQLCGAGGSVEGSAIELQGDQRDRVEPELVRRGFRVKRAGG